MTEIRFNAPSGEEEVSQVREALEGRVIEGCDQGNHRDAKAVVLYPVA